MNSNRFTGEVFVITGAASGIGRELALQAAQDGAEVIATDRNESGLSETLGLGREKSLSIQPVLLDLVNADAIRQFANEVIPMLGRKRLVLVNNAGVGLASGAFGDTDLQDFEWLMNINLWGAIRMTKAFYPCFLSRNEGQIVNLSSVFGLIGVAMNVPYCTSKFALRGFTESLRMELQGTGIAVTSVHPGGIRTNIVRNALVRGNTSALLHEQSIRSFEKNAMTTAKSAASQILTAIEKKKQRLVIGRDGKAIDFLARLLPVAYTGIVGKQLKKAFGLD
jgi:NAD(P)-dependent dehydrogenase (short-subunit alcohol dehydrogenase family)